MAAAKQETLKFDPDRMNILIRQTAMPKMDQSHLGKVLTRYYKEGLGGSDNWDKIESLKVAGSLRVGSGEFEFTAYQKKPAYIKMAIRSDRGELTLASDGKKPWQILPNSSDQAVLMEAEEGRRFMHSANFGNHLLYPYAVGKTVTYIDTVPVEGSICHQIRVTLASDFQIDYFIDIRTYLEIKVQNLDLRSQKTNTLVYKAYNREFAIPIAKKVITYEDGEWVSDLILDEVKVNSGVMPWMFRMPK